jgi:hypothetical protein
MGLLSTNGLHKTSGPGGLGAFQFGGEVYINIIDRKRNTKYSLLEIDFRRKYRQLKREFGKSGNLSSRIVRFFHFFTPELKYTLVAFHPHS